MRKKCCAAVKHPGEINAIVNLGGELDDFRIVVKELAGRKNAGQQQRRVN